MKTNTTTNLVKSRDPKVLMPGHRQNKDELDSREGEEQLVKGDTIITNNKKPRKSSGKKAKKN